MFCVCQEDAAAGEAVEGSSRGGPGLLQSGQHLHASPGLWESHRLPPKTSHHRSGPQRQVAMRSRDINPCECWPSFKLCPFLCWNVLLQDRGRPCVLESGKCPHCTGEPRPSHALCWETPGNLQRGESTKLFPHCVFCLSMFWCSELLNFRHSVVKSASFVLFLQTGDRSGELTARMNVSDLQMVLGLSYSTNSSTLSENKDSVDYNRHGMLAQTCMCHFWQRSGSKRWWHCFYFRGEAQDEQKTQHGEPGAGETHSWQDERKNCSPVCVQTSH